MPVKTKLKDATCPLGKWLTLKPVVENLTDKVK